MIVPWTHRNTVRLNISIKKRGELRVKELEKRKSSFAILKDIDVHVTAEPQSFR